MVTIVSAGRLRRKWGRASAPVAMRLETTSPSLLSRVRDGADVEAWREFDARYGSLVVRYCRQCGLQLSDAEDIRQVVMMRLARSLRTFSYDRRRGRFRTYLGTVVRNEVARHFGRPIPPWSGVEEEEEQNLDEAPDRTDADGKWEREWMLHHLRLAMRRARETFHPRSMRVFEHLLEGRSVEEVAGSFSMDPQAVHKVKQRIRDRLKQFVAGQVLDEEFPDG